MKTNSILSVLFSLALAHLARSQNITAFYIGHSLTDGVVDMVKSLSDTHPNVSMKFRFQSIPGSSLEWSWQAKQRNDIDVIHAPDPFFCGFYHPTYGLPAGIYDALVLTESVPRLKQWIGGTYQYADSFYVYATRHNPNIQVYFYEVWHCLLSGNPTGCAYDEASRPWRQRLDDDFPMWKSVVDTLNKRFKPAKPVRLIPGGQGFAALYDSIQAKVVPGVTTISDLFSDDIHPNDIGRYFISCIHFSIIHGRSPVGLTNRLKDVWDRPYTDGPTVAQALKLQQIAWNVVNKYSTAINPAIDAGHRDMQSSLRLVHSSQTLSVFYDGKFDVIRMYNAQGKLVLSSRDRNIDISSLHKGLYVIKTNDIARVFMKE